MEARGSTERNRARRAAETVAHDRSADPTSEHGTTADAGTRRLGACRTWGLLFQTSTGHQLLQANTLQDSRHPILVKLRHEKGGFNISRRYRITQVQKSGCPAVLRHFWSGHAAGHVAERYTKLLKERDFRWEWAERIGPGFDLPVPVGKLGKLHDL